MNLQNLTPIQVKRTDPISGYEYTFSAAPPIDLALLDLTAEINLATFVPAFFWRVLAGGFDTQHFPNLESEIKELLPLSLMVMEKVKIKFDGPEEDLINLTEGASCFITTDEGPSSRWASIQPQPSATLLTQIDAEVINANATQIAIQFFIAANLTELTEEAASTTDEPPEDKKESTRQRVTINEEYTKYGLHAVGQRFRPLPKKGGLTPQDVTKSWQSRYGEVVDQVIPNYGMMDLNDMETRVLDAIVKRLTETRYKGNGEAVTRNDILAKYNGQLPKSYENIEIIPTLEIGKRELIRLAGMDYDNQAHAERIIQAMWSLAAKQYCLFYERAQKKDGKYQKDKDGKIIKDEIYTICSALNVKEVSHAGQFKHYEIQPASVFLDQHESFFMLIPYDWRQEVIALLKGKKTSKYLYSFLMYLRYQFELKRQKYSNKGAAVQAKTDYKIKYNWTLIAESIGMPESEYKGQKARAMKTLMDGFTIAQKLGYISSFTMAKDIVTMSLIPDKYPRPKKELEEAELIK